MTLRERDFVKFIDFAIAFADHCGRAGGSLAGTDKAGANACWDVADAVTDAVTFMSRGDIGTAADYFRYAIKLSTYLPRREYRRFEVTLREFEALVRKGYGPRGEAFVARARIRRP